MKNRAIVLILAAGAIAEAKTGAVEIDCSAEAMNQRIEQVSELRKAASESKDLKLIDQLIEKRDLLDAEQRICLRSNLSNG